MTERKGNVTMINLVEQLEPHGYVYDVNGVWRHFVKHEPPEDAYDEGTLVPVFTLQQVKDCLKDYRSVPREVSVQAIH